MDQIKALQKIIEKNPNSLLSHFGLGKAYMDQGDFKAAAHHFKEALRIKPDYTAAFRFLGQSLEKGGFAEEAKATYRQGIQVAENSKDMEAGKIMAVFLKRLESASK